MRRRLLKNLTANSLGVCISLIGQIFAVPLFLHLWNKQLYGEWLVLTTVPNLLWSLEGGLGSIAGSRMTLAAAVQNWEEVNAIFQTTLLGQICISLFLFFASLVAILTFNVKSFLVLTDLSQSDTSLIFVLMICYMLGGLLLTLYRAPYRASELEARGAMLVNFWRITDFLITVAVLIFHGRPIYLAIAQLGGVLTWNLIGYFDVTRKCFRVRFGFTHISWQRFREMIIHGMPLLASQAATAFYMQGYPLVIAKTLGPATVVTFTTMRMLCRLGLLAVQTMVWSSAPILSRSYGAADWSQYYRLLRLVIATALWSGIFGLLGFTLIGPWLISLWTSGKVHSDHLTFFLFALSTSLQGIWTCFGSMLGASNRHHAFNYTYTAGTLCALIIVPWFIVWSGFIAVPVVMSITDFLFVLNGLFLCRLKLTNFRYHEIKPLFTAAFYRETFATILKHLQTDPGLSSKA
ncbi:MAG: hypothetical protein LV479_12025 [Methylacidiphilales bacterium]|nr:hypothetical protein [Candidatus Methylacidiphilales bacterium]